MPDMITIFVTEFTKNRIEGLKVPNPIPSLGLEYYILYFGFQVVFTSDLKNS